MKESKLEKSQIKQIIFDFMFNEHQPDEQEQINFENYFEKWWKERNIE